VDLFVDEKNPSYYGDILSALVRAGGAAIRQDGKGIAAISASAPTTEGDTQETTTEGDTQETDGEGE
jgi:hypothetical protein